MIFVIDNYDSFVYNLVQYLGATGTATTVCRNDEVTLDQIEAMRPDLILISPGPASPDQAGISLSAIERFAGQVPIFGVCLGHQCIGQAFGATIRRAGRPMHGKLSQVFHDGQGIFAGLPAALSVVRYHSLVIDPMTLPDCLRVTAVADDGEIMAVAHRTLPVASVQFHPESIFTEHGRRMVHNALASLMPHREAVTV